MIFYPVQHQKCDGLCISVESNCTLQKNVNELHSVFESFDSSVIWVRIPKTASISLQTFLGWENTPWGHYQVNFLINQLGKEKYDKAFKFTFVRNPLARLTSIFEYYRWHDASNLRKGSICIQDFEHWIRKGCPHNIGKFDELFDGGEEIVPGKNILLQKNQLQNPDGIISVDFIGKVENIQEDASELASILQKFNPDFVSSKLTEVPVKNFSEIGVPLYYDHNGDLRELIRKDPSAWKYYYSDNEVLDMAVEIVKDDLYLFNY